jgi:CheY-like chemotaxis protein
MARILVVDDDKDACEVAAARLNRAGHKTDCQTNGRNALLEIMQNTPEVLVLDLVMPELDGTNLLDVIRSYLRLQALPVIVWTALPFDHPTVDHARSYSVDAVIVKGKSTLDDLANAVDHALAA